MKVTSQALEHRTHKITRDLAGVLQETRDLLFAKVPNVEYNVLDREGASGLIDKRLRLAGGLDELELCASTCGENSSRTSDEGLATSPRASPSQPEHEIDEADPAH